MTEIRAQGLVVDVPQRWEVRIQRRGAVAAAERTSTVMHAATFPMPERRDDFGGGVTNLMRTGDAFVTLFEYGPDAAGTPLFAHRGIPRLVPALFGTNRLQRPLPGQLGCQQFFTRQGRAFCLYVVAGSRAALPRIIAETNALLERLEIQ